MAEEETLIHQCEGEVENIKCEPEIVMSHYEAEDFSPESELTTQERKESETSQSGQGLAAADMGLNTDQRTVQDTSFVSIKCEQEFESESEEEEEEEEEDPDSVENNLMGGENEDTVSTAAISRTGHIQWDSVTSDLVENTPLQTATAKTSVPIHSDKEKILPTPLSEKHFTTQSSKDSTVLVPSQHKDCIPFSSSSEYSEQPSNPTEQDPVGSNLNTPEFIFPNFSNVGADIEDLGIGESSLFEMEDQCMVNSNLLSARSHRGRKRNIPDQNRHVRKLRCQLNQPYVNQRGKVVKPREFHDFHCKDKCHERVSLEDRRKEFDCFWNLPSFEAKVQFISNKVSIVDVKRKRVKNASKRSCTRIYTLGGVQVCKQLFTETLRISGGRIDGYLKKKKNFEVITDNRGKSSAVNKLSETRVNEAINHISKFSESYCSEGHTSDRFLPSHITLPILYGLYKNECLEPVSFASYKHIFYTKFNLRHKPKLKDSCNDSIDT